jgi:hypothetical protein
MKSFVVARGRVRAVALACMLVPGLAAASPALGQAPVPLLKHVEGTLAVAPAGDREWTDVRAGRAVQHGERLWTDRGSRAELQLAGHTLRVGGQTQIRIDKAAPNATRIGVLRGTAIARVDKLAAGESFELGTPNLALIAVQPGAYRLDVEPGGVTRVTVLQGLARLYGQRGEQWELRAGQRVGFQGRNLALVAPPGRAAPADELDRWAQAREGRSPTAGRTTQLAAAAAVKPVAAAPAASRAPKRAAPAPRAATARARPVVPGPAVQAQGDPARPPSRAAVERWEHEQENWLRYNHGLPPLPRPAPLAIPARRVG